MSMPSASAPIPSIRALMVRGWTPTSLRVALGVELPVLTGSAHMTGSEVPAKAPSAIRAVQPVPGAGDWSWPLEAVIIRRRAFEELGYAVP